MGARAERTAPARLRLAPHAVLGAFCVGVAGSLCLTAPAAATIGVAVAAGVGALAAAGAGSARAGLGLLAAAALLAGLGWGAARIAQTAPPALDLPARASGTVAVDAPPAPDGRGGLRARARAEDLLADGRRLAPGTRILLDLDAGAGTPPVGAVLRVEGRLRPPAGPSAPGWWRRWLERQGVAARMRPDAVREAGRRGGPGGLRDRWRAWAGANAAAGLSGDRREVVRGMALGGGSRLTEEAADAFRDAGIWHLLAVSGQNVTVVAIAVLAALRALGVARRPAVAGAALVMACYCLACDGGASVGRAGIVGGLGLVAELRSSPRERWHLLLAGLAVLLAAQPRALWDPGLQLSFAAVCGLFLLAPPLAAWWRGLLPGRVADLAAMAGAASLATAPVLVWHFERLSLAGLLLNVAAVPLAAPVVVLALAGLAAGAIVPAAGAALAWAAGLGAEALLLSARAMSALPGAAVDLPSAAALPLLVLAAAPAVAARLLRPGGRGPGRRARRVAVALSLAATLGLVAWAPWRPPAPAPWPAAPAVTVLDVGQGDAILLRGPGGEAALVDTGPPGSPAPVVAALARHGVRRLDAVVLSHDSLDHAGGLADLAGRVRIARVLTPPAPEEGLAAPARAALAAARAAGAGVGVVRAGDAVAVGPWRLRIIWPARQLPRGADPNTASMVAVAGAGDLDVLLTADAESPTLAPLALPAADVLKVAHHGSDDPGLPGILRRVRPAAAVIPVGRGNPFGHPRAATLAALSTAGVAVWRTDLHGDVTMTAAGPGIAVETGR